MTHLPRPRAYTTSSRTKVQTYHDVSTEDEQAMFKCDNFNHFAYYRSLDKSGTTFKSRNSMIATLLYTFNEKPDVFLHILTDLHVQESSYTEDCMKFKDDKSNTPLHKACAHGFVMLVTKYMYNKREYQVVNVDGDTSFHVACEHRHETIISFIVKNSLDDSHKPNKEGNTPMHIICMRNVPRAIESVIPACNINAKNVNGCTPLQIAINMQHIDCVCEIFSHAFSTHNLEYELPGKTLLHYSVELNWISLVSLLLAKGVIDPNVLDANGETPLHVACQMGNVSCAQVLLKVSTCDVNLCNRLNGWAPMHVALYHNKPEIVAMILSHDWCSLLGRDREGNTGLHFACKNGLPDCISLLIEKCGEESTRVRNGEGDYPLDVALKFSNGDCAYKLLLHSETVPDVSVANGNTLLHLAAQVDNHDLMSLSLSKSETMRMNERNKDGQTPLHVAANHGSLQCVDSLINRGCELDLQTKNGDTALHLAVQNGDTVIAQKLLSELANPVIKNQDGDAPIHLAQNVECVKLLVSTELVNLAENINNHGELALHTAIKRGSLPIIRYILHEKNGNPEAITYEGDTPLHVACSANLENHKVLDMVKLLLSTGKADPQCVNKLGATPVQLLDTTNYTVFQELSTFTRLRSNHPLENYVKLFILGNSGTGKSSLIQAIRTETTRLQWLLGKKQVQGVECLTAGIIPIPFYSKHFGHTVLYDFAGQPEYYSSHAAILENLVLPSPPAFLLVIDISEPMEVIEQKLTYWWLFCQNQVARREMICRTSAVPHVLVVASHTDVVKKRKDDPAVIIRLVQEIVIRLPATFHYAGCYALDCRSLKSDGLQKLLKQLTRSCKQLRITVDIDLRCHALLAYVREMFPQKECIKLGELTDSVGSEDTLIPSDLPKLMELLSTLHDSAQLLLLKNQADLQKSWLVLQKEEILGEINGSIFAPENFKQHCPDFARSTGVVPHKKVTQHFPKYDSSMITGFLSHLEFCFRIEDSLALEMIEADATVQSEVPDIFYFFPALVGVESPSSDKVWKCVETDQSSSQLLKFGWFYKCKSADYLLSSRFLHVLILRLAFSFALTTDPRDVNPLLPVIHRRCTVWKHGIAWLDCQGLEVIVEVGLQRRWVVVLIRCFKAKQRVQCAQLLSAITKVLRNTQAEFCPSVSMSEFMISPSSVQYPLGALSSIVLYRIEEVAFGVVHGKDSVIDTSGTNITEITSLLPFEPYHGYGVQLLEKLFGPISRCKPIKPSDLSELVEKAYHKLELFEAALQPHPFRYEELCSKADGQPTKKCLYLFEIFMQRFETECKFKNFEAELSKCSIFAGRNPLVDV